VKVLGVDVGGSGIKGALVDLDSGELASERKRIRTPRPARPEAVIRTIHKIIKAFDYKGPVGVGFPAVVMDGIVRSAANVADEWVNFPGQERMAEVTGQPVTLVNDADAAGIAEMRFGAGRDCRGLVMIITLGTGIGSALFIDGRLVPNTELGHLFLSGHMEDAEEYASDRTRSQEDLSWKVWAGRLDEYLRHLEAIFSPAQFILGGGVSKQHRRYFRHLTVGTPVAPAQLRNEAGIVGAAMATTGEHLIR
jgi:polyphosphate glucokinase